MSKVPRIDIAKAKTVNSRAYNGRPPPHTDEDEALRRHQIATAREVRRLKQEQLQETARAQSERRSGRSSVNSTIPLRTILKRWDSGNAKLREVLLRNFLEQYASATGPELELAFENGASLFLTRISACLRLTFLFGHLTTLLLRSVAVFVNASSGQKYLTEFLEVGGVTTVVAILSLDRAPEEAKQEGLRLLTSVCAAGRAYKELICEGPGDGDGVVSIAQCLAHARSDSTRELARNLLHQLGQGNPVYFSAVCDALLFLLSSAEATAQRMASQVLRLLIPIKEPTVKFVEPILLMLRSLDLQVQYEAGELVKMLIGYHTLHDPLLQGLVSLLHPAGDVMDNIDTAHGLRGAPSLIERRWLVRQPSQSIIPAAFPQQAAAARILGMLAELVHAVGGQMLEMGALQGLFAALANVNHYEAQHNAYDALTILMELFPHVDRIVRRVLDPGFFNNLLAHPEATLKSLPPEQVDLLLELSNALELAEHEGNEFSLEYELPSDRPKAPEMDMNAMFDVMGAEPISEARGGLSRNSSQESLNDMPEHPAVKLPFVAPFAFPEPDKSAVTFHQSVGEPNQMSEMLDDEHEAIRFFARAMKKNLQEEEEAEAAEKEQQETILPQAPKPRPTRITAIPTPPARQTAAPQLRGRRGRPLLVRTAVNSVASHGAQR